jgi:hypothetical protein
MPQAEPKEPPIDESFPLGPGTFALEASNGRWRAFKHLVVVIELLMYLVQGRFNRLMVFMPPRHGKSWLISKYFLAWFLGSFPDLRVILATRDATFSAKWGRITKQLLEKYGKRLFVKEIGYKDENGELKRIIEPNQVELDKSSNASYRWDIKDHDGGLFTAGIGTGILGEGAHGLIIDDPSKGFKKVNSKAHQLELNDWFYTEGTTRLDKDMDTGRNPWIIYIAQRLGTKDLAGQILNGFHDDDPGEPHIDASEALEILRGGGSIEPGTWVVLNLPALAEENDILGRSEGEALCPQIKDEEELRKIQKAMGSFRFEAIYQGNPREREGKIFKREWFLDERGEILGSILTNSQKLPDPLNELRYWDFAASGEEGDNLAATKTGYYQTTRMIEGAAINLNEMVVRGLLHGKYSSNQVLNRFEKITIKDGKSCKRMVEQEPGSMAKLLITKFRRNRKLKGYPKIQADKVKDSKLDRSFDLEVMAETGRLLFDTDSLSTSEIKKIVYELIEFTGEEGGEDNITDTLTGSARHWERRRRKVKV